MKLLSAICLSILAMNQMAHAADATQSQVRSQTITTNPDSEIHLTVGDLTLLIESAQMNILAQQATAAAKHVNEKVQSQMTPTTAVSKTTNSTEK